jgi:GNAT superfamily N-acetyltransferase
MAIDVRHADPGDADVLADVHVASWRVAYRGVIPDAVLDSPALDDARRAGWRRQLVDRGGFPPAGWDDDNEIFAGALDGRVVGFGHVGREWDGEAASSSDDHRSDPDGPGGAAAATPTGELYGFYVHPDAWGTGLADALIERCHDALRRRFDAASLWVLRDNPRARRFYERHGWICGEGAALEEALWPGPQMDGMPELDAPLVEVRYRRAL